MKLHVADNGPIDFIQFKNIKIALDMDVYVFLVILIKITTLKCTSM